MQQQECTGGDDSSCSTANQSTIAQQHTGFPMSSAMKKATILFTISFSERKFRMLF